MEKKNKEQSILRNMNLADQNMSLHIYLFKHKDTNKDTNPVLSEGLPFSVTGHKSECCGSGG